MNNGLDYLRLSAEQQSRCELRSRRHVEETPELECCLISIGELLLLLDHFGSCYWGCKCGSHVIEQLVGRTVSHASSVLRLIDFGQYDEAFSLIRALQELGNLMWLFFKAPATMQEWISLPAKDQWKHFAPSAVRKKLEKLDETPPNSPEDYALLSGIAHVHPRSVSQGHNSAGVTTMGGYYQQRGQEEAIARLCWTVSAVAGSAALLSSLDDDKRALVVNAAIALAEVIPTSHPDETESCLELQQLAAQVTARKHAWTGSSAREGEA